MKHIKLGPSEALEGLGELDGWQLSDNGKAISRSFSFRNFIEAFGFMTESAFAAERLNHHPEWFNVYRRVDVKLTTHDADGLTELDFKLAAAMDRAASMRA